MVGSYDKDAEARVAQLGSEFLISMERNDPKFRLAIHNSSLTDFVKSFTNTKVSCCERIFYISNFWIILRQLSGSDSSRNSDKFCENIGETNDFREIVLHYCSNILQNCSMSTNSPFIFRKRFHCFDMTYSDVTSSRKKTNKTCLGQHGINNSFRRTRGIFSRRIFEHQTYDLTFDSKRFAAKNEDNETLN